MWHSRDMYARCANDNPVNNIHLLSDTKTVDVNDYIFQAFVVMTLSTQQGML